MGTFAETPGPTAILVKPRRAPWLKRIAWRILAALFVLWAAATFTFFLQERLPGRKATLILNQEHGTQQPYSASQLKPVEEKYSFDESVTTQYINYIKGL